MYKDGLVMTGVLRMFQQDSRVVSKGFLVVSTLIEPTPSSAVIMSCVTRLSQPVCHSAHVTVVILDSVISGVEAKGNRQ